MTRSGARGASRSFLLVGVVLSSLLLAEGVARLIVAPQPLLFGRPLESGPLHDRSYAVALENDPELFWRLAPDVRLDPDAGIFRGVVSNAQGLRADHEIPLEKGPREIRILFLGDSVTFGWRLRHDETFPYLTERALHARFPEVPITCINAGVPGYTSFQGWRFLETEGFAYGPDLVVLNFGFNEPNSWGAGQSDFEQYAFWRSLQPPKALAWSRVAALVWRLGGRLEPKSPRRRPRLTTEEFRDVLGRIREATRVRDVALLVLVPGLPENVDGKRPGSFRSRYQRELSAFAERIPFGPGAGTALLDGVPTLQRLAASHALEELFLDHVHPSRLTNESTARLLADAIAPWLQTRIRYGPGAQRSRPRPLATGGRGS